MGIISVALKMRLASSWGRRCCNIRSIIVIWYSIVVVLNSIHKLPTSYRSHHYMKRKWTCLYGGCCSYILSMAWWCIECLIVTCDWSVLSQWSIVGPSGQAEGRSLAIRAILVLTCFKNWFQNSISPFLFSILLNFLYICKLAVRKQTLCSSTSFKFHQHQARFHISPLEDCR